jgi:Enoyl-(Acyl carrier protein) reductase
MMRYQLVLRACTQWAEDDEPRGIAQAVAYLSSDWAAFVTGATLAVDGGWTPFGGAGEVAIALLAGHPASIPEHRRPISAIASRPNRPPTRTIVPVPAFSYFSQCSPQATIAINE